MGYTGVMFQIPKDTSLYDAVWSTEHFDAFFFYWNRPKNEAVPSKKLWGSENDNLGQIFYSTLHFIDFSAVMYLFVVKNPFMKVQKIGPSVFVKTVILRQIKTGGGGWRF